MCFDSFFYFTYSPSQTTLTMSYEINPKQLSLIDLAKRCSEETELFRIHQDHDTRYCFELFRRAIHEQDQLAWDMICKQYESIIANWWIKPHRGFKVSGEDVEQVINRTFEKFWSALSPEKFDGFSNLGSLLRYLKMCVHSVITDYNRLEKKPSFYLTDREERITSKDPNSFPEKKVVDREYKQEFWDWICSQLKDEKELLVVYGTFSLNLKPKELYSKFLNRFNDVDEIYTTKQNILARLRRNPELQKFLDGNN